MGTVEVGEDGYDDFGRKKIKARADKKAKEVRMAMAMAIILSLVLRQTEKSSALMKTWKYFVTRGDASPILGPFFSGHEMK